MFLTITSIIGFLVLVNLLLLKFSCNKTNRKTVSKKVKNVPVYTTRMRLGEESQIELAPTGS